MRVEPFMNGINALIKETPESPLAPSTMCRHNEKPATQKEGLMLASLSWAFRLRAVRNKLFISHLVCGILL